MYRYIGNKTRLMPFIVEKVKGMIGENGTVADIMAGTGAVSFELRKQGYTLIASDMMTYSFHHLNVNLLLGKSPSFQGLIGQGIINDTRDPYLAVLDYLNELKPKENYFFNEFSPDGTPGNGTEPRKYFTSENAKKIDAIRDVINEWKGEGLLTVVEESLSN